MVKFFKSQSDFRKWLEKNYNKSDEIFVGFYKVSSNKKSITYPQALDEAICYGWIDGNDFSGKLRGNRELCIMSVHPETDHGRPLPMALHDRRQWAAP